MSRRTGLTSHTLEAFRVLANLELQINDRVRLTNVGPAPGRIYTGIAGTAIADDGEYSVHQAGQANQLLAATEVSSVVASALDVVHPVVFDNTDSDVINVAIADVELGKRYLVSPATANALPAGVVVRIDQDNADGSLDFIITNNSGEDFAAGTISVNVYQA